MGRTRRILFAYSIRARAPCCDRSASRNEIIAAIKAVISGLSVLPPELLATLLHEAPLADDLLKAKVSDMLD